MRNAGLKNRQSQSVRNVENIASPRPGVNHTDPIASPETLKSSSFKRARFNTNDDRDRVPGGSTISLFPVTKLSERVIEAAWGRLLFLTSVVFPGRRFPGCRACRSLPFRT